MNLIDLFGTSRWKCSKDTTGKQSPEWTMAEFNDTLWTSQEFTTDDIKPPSLFADDGPWIVHNPSDKDKTYCRFRLGNYKIYIHVVYIIHI